MRRWRWPAALVAVGTVVVLFGAQAATGATTKTLSFDAAALVPYATITTHFTPTRCSDNTFDQADGELNGALLQFRGGMLFPIQLPEGAKVTRLRYFVVDQDSTDDSFVFLLRKKLEAGVPKDAGYSVMASAHSTGNVLTNVRRFDETTIAGALADPTQFAYYLELVNCAITIEPIGVQVTMTG